MHPKFWYLWVNIFLYEITPIHPIQSNPTQCAIQKLTLVFIKDIHDLRHKMKKILYYINMVNNDLKKF